MIKSRIQCAFWRVVYLWICLNAPLQASGQSLSLAQADKVDSASRASSAELVQRALSANADLAAARLETERARARLLQSGLRPNPTLEVEQGSGRLANNPGDRATTIGVSLPLEITGQRRRRIELGQAELEAAQAEVADRERRLAKEVRIVYGEVLAATRELEIITGINQLDAQTVRVIEVRVSQGDAAPLEASLLRVEADRLRARRALVEGRLQATLLRLKVLAGMSPDEPLQVRAELQQPVSHGAPTSLDAAVEIALRTRPDLRLARLLEEAAQAGLRLVKAQARPQVTLNARYLTDHSLTSLPQPLAPFPDSGRSLSFGASITLPTFNRNQGAKAEAAAAIVQAQHRRQFIESAIRAEVVAAFARIHAAQLTIAIFEQDVLTRADGNIRTIRAAYDAGAFRITELIAEQRRLLDAQREFTEALAEHYRASAELKAAMGMIQESGENK